MWAVFWKELADHFGRRRFVLLLVTVLLGVVWGSFIDVDRLIATGAGFFFLDVFLSADSVPISLLEFLAFFGPIIGIALGFDAINGERTQGRWRGSSRNPCTATPCSTGSSWRDSRRWPSSS